MKQLVTKSFAAQCLAFPDKVDQMLAEVTTVAGAKDMLDKASAMKHYAERLEAGVELERPIAIGVIKIKTKLGDLMPAGKRGRGNKIVNPVVDFSKPTIAAYRKMAKHKKRFDWYCKDTNDVPSQAGFIGWITKNDRAAKEKKRELERRANAKKAKATKAVDTLDGIFSTVLVDPPWSWDDEGDKDQLGRAKPDYATMTIDELLALPVSQLASENAHMYCWVTNRSMPKVFDLLEAWDFRYIALLTWPKKSFGMGNYFRGQTEHIAFGVRGSLSLKVKNASTLLPNWKRQKGHSAKPTEIYSFIEKCSPGPYLEMFARTQRDNWKAWGCDV